MRREQNTEEAGRKKNMSSEEDYAEGRKIESDEMRALTYRNRPSLYRGIQQLKKSANMLRRRKKFMILIILAVVVVGCLIYNNMRVFEEYDILVNEPRSDVSSTGFAEMDGKLIKYSSDGIIYMNADQVIWSSAYNIQTPIVDVCEKMIVVGEQNGSQIYIYDAEKGQVGNFQTLLPIQKVRVASQGVVAAVLEDGEVTWINLYDKEGNEIARHRTSVAESGYPLDIAISPDGVKMVVSFLTMTNGIMTTQVVFYNFGVVGQAQTNNQTNSETYENTIVPKVEYLDDTTAVAFRDNGFTIFKGKQIQEKKAEVELDQDIVSIFYDSEVLGFVFQSDISNQRYKIQLYNLNGKKTMEQYINEDFVDIKMNGGKIMLYNSHNFSIYSIHGKKIFEGTYQEPIVSLMKISGFRKYLVITEKSMDQIRLK